MLRKRLEQRIGTNMCSDAFLSLLREKGASDKVLHAFQHVSLPCQTALSDGILFAEYEMIRRNEFIKGCFIVIGARSDYSFYVLNLQTGGVGLIPSRESSDGIAEGDVELVDSTFLNFFAKNGKVVKRSDLTYLVPEYFHVDTITVMQALSDYGMGEIAQTPVLFRQWLHAADIQENFCLYKMVPVQEMAAGACVLFPYRQIIAVNYAERRFRNPKFMVVGSCPDGNLVVLDTRHNIPAVGYVAFEEVGDEEIWDNHYLQISPSLGSFLHDSNFLGILPDDYYQAQNFGYRSRMRV